MSAKEVPNPFQAAQLNAAVQQQSSKPTNPFHTPSMIAVNLTEEQQQEQGESSEQIARLREELEKREQQLQDKENLLAARENDVKAHNPELNWPPCWPLVAFYPEFVPNRHRFLLKLGFAYLNMHVVALVWNLLCNVLVFDVICFLVGIIYVALGTFVSNRFHFRILQKCLKTEVVPDTKMFAFLLHMCISAMFDAVMLTGSACGIGIRTVTQANTSSLKTAFVTSTLLWLANTVLAIVILKKATAAWKNSGGSISTAKAGLASEAVSEVVSDSNSSWGAAAKNRAPTITCVVQ